MPRARDENIGEAFSRDGQVTARKEEISDDLDYTHVMINTTHKWRVSCKAFCVNGYGSSFYPSLLLRLVQLLGCRYFWEPSMTLLSTPRTTSPNRKGRMTEVSHDLQSISKAALLKLVCSNVSHPRRRSESKVNAGATLSWKGLHPWRSFINELLRIPFHPQTQMIMLVTLSHTPSHGHISIPSATEPFKIRIVRRPPMCDNCLNTLPKFPECFHMYTAYPTRACAPNPLLVPVAAHNQVAYVSVHSLLTRRAPASSSL